MKTNSTTPAGPIVAFQRLLVAGLGVWLLAQFALVGVGLVARSPKNWIGAVDWAIGHSWIGFLAGLLGLLVLAPRNPGGLRRALISYAAPAGIYAVLGAICYSVYPDQWFLMELLGFMPLVWFFGVIGWLWLRLRPAEPVGDALACALLPPLIGGLAVIVGVAYPTFRGNPFIYRKAFEVGLKKTVFADGKLTADAVLEIRKPGDYRFRAVKYCRSDMMEVQDPDADFMIGRIEWAGGGAPVAAATGTYPLTIHWDKSAPPSKQIDDETFDDSIVIEVSTSADPETVVRTLSMPLVAN